MRSSASALALALALLAPAGAARAADVLVEADRYESPRGYGERSWRGEVYEAPRHYGRRYVDEDEDDLRPPAPVPSHRRWPPERYGAHERYEPPGVGPNERYDRRYREERIIVERPGWQRRVVNRPIFEDDDEDEDCRIIVRRRANPWGEAVIERRRICD